VELRVRVRAVDGFESQFQSFWELGTEAAFRRVIKLRDIEEDAIIAYFVV
jgi:hypothetical protein